MNPFRRIAGRYMEAHCKQPIEVQYIGIRPVYYPVAEILFSAGDVELKKYTIRRCIRCGVVCTSITRIVRGASRHCT